MLVWASLPPPVINLYITCCSDCTTRTLHMPKPGKPSLSQNEVEVLKLKLCQQLTWPYCGHILSDHGPIIALHVCLGQWPLVSLALSMALCTQETYTCIWPRVLQERWRDVRTGSSSPELLPGCFHTSSDCYFTASTSRKHITQSYHLQLIRSNMDFTLWTLGQFLKQLFFLFKTLILKKNQQTTKQHAK